MVSTHAAFHRFIGANHVRNFENEFISGVRVVYSPPNDAVINGIWLLDRIT